MEKIQLNDDYIVLNAVKLPFERPNARYQIPMKPQLTHKTISIPKLPPKQGGVEPLILVF